MLSIRVVVLSVFAALLTVLAPTQPGTAHQTGAPADPGVVSEWNEIAVTTLTADAATVPPRKAPVESYLYLAFMHAAVYNAVVGIEGRYRPYRFHARAPRRASSQAAAVAAAHRVLVTYSPEQRVALDAAYDDSLADIPDGRAKSRGLAYGELAADRLIAQRTDDGRNADIRFTQAPAPGVWRPTPPALAPFSVPWLGYVKPLLVRSGTQFGDPGPPPALTSRRYTRDFDEVKALGSATSSTRTPAQTETATFYSGNAVVQTSAALRDQARLRHLDIVDAARMFAAVHASVADAVTSVWYSKHHYGFWRPITAIQLAADDGNPATSADPGWAPLLATPPYPDYVSGYNGVIASFTRALQETLGTRHLRLTLTSTAFPAGDERATRFYDTGGQVRREVIDARVWLGIHFRFADTAAARMGQQVARYALDHYFRPVQACHVRG